MCATECTIHDSVKQRVIKAKDRDTIVTGVSTGHPVRVLKNKLAKQIQELDRANRPEEIEALGAGKLALCMREGDVEHGSIMAGQCAAMVGDVRPAAEIVHELVSGAEAVIASLPRFVR
jgi:enoyl-[acyl-carrier protein] reductase II